MKDTTETVCQRNSSKPLTESRETLYLWRTKCVDVHIQGNSDSIFFSGRNPPFWTYKIWPIFEICIFTGNADLIFLSSNLYPFWTVAKIILCNSDETGFLSDCPSLLLGIAIGCIQHSQAMLQRGVCELAHSFFHY